MLRGFRWQFLALIAALVLFIISLLSRVADDTPQPSPTPDQQPTAELTEQPTAVANPGVVITPVDPVTGVITYREGLVGSVQRLNPLFVDLNPVDRDISSLIFEGLTRVNSYGEPIPALAESWVISSNSLEYIVQLRSDVLWQDGVPFTAEDVLYTMSLLRSPDFPGEEEVGAFWRTVETDQLDTHLVRFRLTQPLGSFLDKLRVGILPAHALQGTSAANLLTHPFNLSPIGTGPYQLEALRGANGVDTVDLRVAPVYRQRPEGQIGYNLNRVSFRLYDRFDEALAALNAGDIDGLATENRYQRTPLLNAAQTPNLSSYTTTEAAVGVIVFNWQRENVRFFREQRVRLGLETGIDRSSIIERALPNAAVQADSPLFPGSWAYAGDLVWPPYDATNARFLLETANLRRGDDDSTEEATEEASPFLLEFSILTPDDPALVNLIREVAAQWSQIGVDVTVVPQSVDNYQAQLESGDFDAALVELSLGGSADPDVYPFWHQGQYPDGDNYGGVDDRRISEELERGRQEPNGLNRIIYYTRFQHDFVDRAIALPLYYPLYTYAVADKVEGVQIGFIGSPSDRFVTIRDWAILQG